MRDNLYVISLLGDGEKTAAQKIAVNILEVDQWLRAEVEPPRTCGNRLIELARQLNKLAEDIRIQ